MKILMCLAVVFIFTVQIAFLQTSHCRVIQPNDAQLIEQTCRKTPNPPVRLSSLKSDPRSAQADLYGLCVIMIDVVKAKSTPTMDKIKELLKQSPGDKSLKECVDDYKTVLEDNIPVAYEALESGKLGFARESMNDAVIEANSCREVVSDTSPLKDMSKVVADVSSVAAATIDAFSKHM